MGALERAAQKHRRRQEKAKPEAAGPSPRTVARLKRVMLSQALEGTSKLGQAYGFLEAGVCLFGPAGYLVYQASRGPEPHVLWMFGAVVAGALSYGIVDAIRSRLTTAWRVQRLRRIGYGFDADAYIEQLSNKRHDGVIVANVELSEALPEARRQLCIDAVRGWVPQVLSATLDDSGRRLSLITGEIDGTQYLRGGRVSAGGTIFSNREIHGCFLRLLRAIARLDKVTPVSTLAVDVEGHVVDIMRTPYGK